MAEPIKCPFCGRIPTVEDCGTNRWFVRCQCGIAQDKLYHQRCDAVRAWNRRKSVTDVPSAQPESHREWYMKGYRDAQPRWIPCEERLPEEDGHYLASYGDHVGILAYGKPLMPMNGRLTKKPRWYHWDREGDYYRDGVVAWMPLLEPYKGGADMRGTE